MNKVFTGKIVLHYTSGISLEVKAFLREIAAGLLPGSIPV
jgi:hypothetical protein